MYLREIDIVADLDMLYDAFHDKHPKFHQQFNMHQCCVSDNFLRRIMGKIATGSVTKFFLSLLTLDSCIDEKYNNHWGVLHIKSHFDFEHYLTLNNDTAKKRMIAGHIRNEFEGVFDKEGCHFHLLPKILCRDHCP